MRRRLTLCALMVLMVLLAGAAATQTHAMGAMNQNATVANMHLTDGFGGMGMQLATTGTTYSEGQQVAIYANDGVATTNLAMTGFYDQNGTIFATASGPPTFCLASLSGATPWTTLLTANGPPMTIEIAASANLANRTINLFTLASSTSPPLTTSTALVAFYTRDELGAVAWTTTPMQIGSEVAFRTQDRLLGAVAFNRTPANFTSLRT